MNRKKCRHCVFILEGRFWICLNPKCLNTNEKKVKELIAKGTPTKQTSGIIPSGIEKLIEKLSKKN